MKELLEKLLSSELLTEEVKTELAEGIQKAIEEQVEVQVNEQREALVVEYATQFAADREALIEALDTKVQEMLEEHLAELADDISNFRDLEVEYAANLADARAALAEAAQEDMSKLIERLDTFLELRLSEEVEELKESIEEVRKNNLGRKIFEAFKGEIEEFVSIDAGVDELRSKLAEAESKLAEREALLAEAQKEMAAAARKEKLEAVLSTLHGRPREIMEAILVSVPTEKLEESFEKFIGRVLHESVTKNSEKESAAPAVEAPVLAEGEAKEVKQEESLTEGVTVVNGDSEVVAESVQPKKQQMSDAALQAMRLAGIHG